MLDLHKEELTLLRSFRTPARVQDFLDTLPMNFEEGGDTLMSPRRVLREKKSTLHGRGSVGGCRLLGTKERTASVGPSFRGRR